MRTLARLGLVAVLAAVVGCAAPPRDPLQVQAIADGEEAFARDLQAFRARTLERLLARADAIAAGRTRDDGLDVLALSGGADWGAFGAGYLARWHELGEAAAVPMPEFDVIGGISTGALIGTYVAGGTAERFAGIEDFYRGTSEDWVRFAGLTRLLPRNSAILENDGIREEIERAVDATLVADLRAAHADNRVIAAGTTNLDFGRLQFFDLGLEASELAEPEPRIVAILMAATAIPGVFAPVEIDGHLHADGGAVQGVPALPPSQLPILAERWRERWGERPLPPIRFWFIFNNQLELQPRAVGLAWFDIVFRSYQTISQTSFRAPLQASVLQAERGLRFGAPPPSVRWVAIPNDFVPPQDARPFAPAVTNALADIGREVAATADGGWRSDYPE